MKLRKFITQNSSLEVIKEGIIWGNHKPNLLDLGSSQPMSRKGSLYNLTLFLVGFDTSSWCSWCFSFDWLAELWKKMGRTSFQAIRLWIQWNGGLTRSNKLLKEEFIWQASTTRRKYISSNGWGSPNQGKRVMKNP